MRDPVVALVVAEPGRLRDAWRALLVAVPGVAGVYMADDAAAALRLVEAQRPGLVLLDGDLRDGAVAGLVEGIKRLQPNARSIVLVCCTGEQWQAAQFHADAVLVKGFAAARLFETVSQVLANGG